MTDHATIKAKFGHLLVDKAPSIFDFKSVSEVVMFITGVTILVTHLPFVGLVAGSACVWECLDRGFRGGIMRTGTELSGWLCATVVPWWLNLTHNFSKRFVKRDIDSFMVSVAFLLGVVIPAMFFFVFWHHMTYGFSLWVFWIYHTIRLGPFVQNFAYAYTMCHKEGHAYSGLWKQEYSNQITDNWFNWWVGLFYGIPPANFAVGHSINHHRYNNGPNDVVSTADKQRDHFWYFIGYIPRFGLYEINVSTIIQFAQEKNWKIVWRVAFAMVYYAGWYLLFARYSIVFTVAYVLYPLIEGNIFLSCINWCWHAFVNPEDPEDGYVNSITILDGPVNVLNEDYHLVHHQYPGGHWEDYLGYRKKHWDQYIAKQATVFRGPHCFEVFFLIVLRDYGALADMYVDLKGEQNGKPLSRDEVIEMLKIRLRSTWWGVRAPKNLKLRGHEEGNYTDGIHQDFKDTRYD